MNERNEERIHRFRPIRVTGEDAKKIVDEIMNPKPLTDEQKAFFSEVRLLGERRKIKETFENTLKYITQGVFTKEQLEQIAKAIENNNS